MVEKWNAVLAEESKDLVSFKQFGEPVSVETQVVAGTNYRFTFADGTTVTVWETLHNMFKIQDVNRATQKGCPIMECGCPPEDITAIIKDEKTGCNHCACYPRLFNPSKCECPGHGTIGLPSPTNLECPKGYKLTVPNYEHQCSDGSRIDCSGRDWMCRGPHGYEKPTYRKDHSFSFNASAATNNGLILFLAVIGICMTLFYGVQYTRKLFQQDYTAIKEEV